MDTIQDGICLFCLEKAHECYSSHGRSFDGYICYCEGTDKYHKAQREAERIIEEALAPAKRNKEDLERKKRKEELIQVIQEAEDKLTQLREEGVE